MVLVSTTTTTSFDRTGGPFSPWTWRTRGTQSVTLFYYGVYLCIYYLANILRSFVCTLRRRCPHRLLRRTVPTKWSLL